MKRKKVNGENEVKEIKEYREYDAPKDYKDKTTDLVGFWNPDKGPIHFVPRFCRAFDGKQDPEKPSVMIIGEAVDSFPVVNKDDERFDCKPGDTVGVFYKPGMAAIKTLADVKVFMYPCGEQETGKDNPMIVFRVKSPSDRGNLLFVTEDYRKQSRSRTPPIPLKNHSRPNPKAPVDDDENFNDKSDVSFP